MADNIEIMAIELGIAAAPSIKIVQSIGSVLHGVLIGVSWDRIRRSVA